MNKALYQKRINPEESFRRVVTWIKNRAQKDNIPGIIVGVSGTDSLVVFLAAHQAYKELGKPECVTAVNFVHNGEDFEDLKEGMITCAGADDKDWFAREILPWLKTVAPEAHYVVDDTIPFSDDNKRWGNIFSRAISDTTLNHGMLNNHQFVAGTRNRTEAILGTYTLLSRTPSMQPIEHLYKSEILDICQSLGVPQLAMDKSREIDCDCGRFDVQAYYLDELDQYMMVQQGDADPETLKTIQPDILGAVREFYVEERSNNAFREKVPYRPTPTKTVYSGEDIETALSASRGDIDDVHAISIVTPRIVTDKDADNAFKIVTLGAEDKTKWMAESFALLGTDGLTVQQKQQMCRAIFGDTASTLNEGSIESLSGLTDKIGQFGFSFPAKRFTTQRFAQGLSLIERAGFKRRERETDVRDASLPKYNPQRDEFGIGFTWNGVEQDETATSSDWYVEQRRAYLLFSSQIEEHRVTLLIRNSSHFFGRDRLQYPAYVSFDGKNQEDLLKLTATDIEDSGQFTPWHKCLSSESNLSLSERFSRMAYAVDALEGIDLKFSQWLRNHKGRMRFKSDFEPLNMMFNDAGGYTHLREFLKESLSKHVEAERAGSPLYLAQLNPKEIAPWKPHRICSVDTDMLAQLKALEEGGEPLYDEKLKALFHPLGMRQLILMSGRYGDFPARPRL